MPIQPFTAELQPNVVAFNARIRAGGSPYALPKTPTSLWLPKAPGRSTFMEVFLAVDGDAVRGGYVIKHQPFAVAGEVKNVDNLQLPLSEGSVDPKYRGVSVQILAHAQKKNPLLYALGMGGLKNPLPTMLASMGWRMTLVPFLFRVVRPAPFLRNIKPLRTSKARELAADVLAFSGLGSLTLRPMHAVLTRPSLSRFTHQVDEVPEFGNWADAIWDSSHSTYSLIARRGAEDLSLLYPREKEKLIRIRVSNGGRAVGWAVMLATKMSGHKQFGDMHLGTVVDCLAVPGHEGAVVRAATRTLMKRKVDLIATNQLRDSWVTAFRQSGFLAGPSNYVFATSKKLTAAVGPTDLDVSRAHMTRGDGDGPIHL
jgi:hypothetical protein